MRHAHCKFPYFQKSYFFFVREIPDYAPQGGGHAAPPGREEEQAQVHREGHREEGQRRQQGREDPPLKVSKQGIFPNLNRENSNSNVFDLFVRERRANYVEKRNMETLMFAKVASDKKEEEKTKEEEQQQQEQQPEKEEEEGKA